MYFYFLRVLAKQGGWVVWISSIRLVLLCMHSRWSPPLLARLFASLSWPLAAFVWCVVHRLVGD